MQLSSVRVQLVAATGWNGSSQATAGGSYGPGLPSESAGGALGPSPVCVGPGSFVITCSARQSTTSTVAEASGGPPSTERSTCQAPVMW